MWEMEEDEEKKSATESTSGGISAIASSLPATRRWMRKWLLVIAPESERVRIFRGFEGCRKQMENIHVALIQYITHSILIRNLKSQAIAHNAK